MRANFKITVPGTLRPGVASRYMTGSLTAIFPDKLRRCPYQIPEIRDGFDKDLANATKRDPIITAFQNHLEDRPQPFICIGDPFESSRR